MQLNSDEIEKLLPHRYPFLLVDRVSECEPGKLAVGRKCVTASEPFFQGHFPEAHVMPGVLIIEALAQTGAVAILSEEANRGKIAFFGGIKNARLQLTMAVKQVLKNALKLLGIQTPNKM